ncbi:hypothetical protein LJY25_07970 [Hymenobacter sp. BT175]|uniref:hypothetical protein n=1 Tax=Hymenobacter translucens TaxID=2886507 RepID=UPI001D0EFB34|nr:hypothetical protein [Hymenobacter translucens]MCC2546378.1 hypothetical protein [Hymenobacter translucens]
MKLLLMLVVLFSTAAGTPPAISTKQPARKPVAAASASLVSRFDLAPLWSLHGDGEAEARVMLGYLGPQYRRLELVFQKVRRDRKNPAVYHVAGKTRERERILPFTGTITLTSMRKVRVPKGCNCAREWNHYQATGRFRLTESAAVEGSGTFSGTLTMMFSRTPNGVAYLPAYKDDWGYTEGKGEGTTFTSTWRNPESKKPLNLLWASNFMEIAPTVMENFYAGDRGMHINPRYARMGWNRYWENEEWWADDEPIM